MHVKLLDTITLFNNNNNTMWLMDVYCAIYLSMCFHRQPLLWINQWSPTSHTASSCTLVSDSEKVNSLLTVLLITHSISNTILQLRNMKLFLLYLLLFGYSCTISTFCSQLKVLDSYFSFVFLMQKSILYAKIAISQKQFFSKFSFKYDIGLLFS